MASACPHRWHIKTFRAAICDDPCSGSMRSVSIDFFVFCDTCDEVIAPDDRHVRQMLDIADRSIVMAEAACEDTRPLD